MIATGTPSPDIDAGKIGWRCVLCDCKHFGAPEVEERCVLCGTYVRACSVPSNPRHAPMVVHRDGWPGHGEEGQCAGKLPEAPRLERYVAGDADARRIPTRDGRKR